MRIFIYIALAIIVTSCGSARVILSGDLRHSNDEYKVKGRQGLLIKQKLSFGEYKTLQVKRSWTGSASSRAGLGWTDPVSHEWINLISFEYIDKKQTVNFALTDGQQESQVFCVSRFQGKDLHIGRRENSLLNITLDLMDAAGESQNLYYVQVYIKGAGGVPWELVLDNQASQAKAKTYVGVFARDSRTYYTIHPIYHMEVNGKQGTMPIGSIGFEIRDPKGRAVAGVSLLDNGMVYLGKTTREERFLMANLCAALLLQEQL